MAWLWLVSVGVSDVQFPVWKQDEYGQWSELRRFEIGRGGVRIVHQGLLAIRQAEAIAFPRDLPASLPREEARDLRLRLDVEGDIFIASIAGLSAQGASYRISDQSPDISNAGEPQVPLPLYCPKVGELLHLASETFGQEPLTVVTLNTHREAGLPDGRDEPIASGPLVAKFLAERLGLDWRDGGGQIPTALGSGIATWVDILIGDEAMEDPLAQGRVVRRLTDLIKAWQPAGERRIAVTTAGGMPPLKPIIERVPAICLGQAAVRLLDRPERGPVSATALDYHARVAERETLRFHCAESLRLGDYASAYGLANRAAKQPWARAVRDGLGALLEFPGSPLRLGDRNLHMSALTACRIEVRLCFGDMIGVLMRLGTFVESSTWELIPRDARIHRLQLLLDRDDECLVGPLRRNHPLVRSGMLERDSKGEGRHRVLDLNWQWPNWLLHEDGEQVFPAQALADFNRRYGLRARALRNRYIHGTDAPIDPQDVVSALRNADLIAGMDRPFGENFLCVPEVRDLLTHTDWSDLAVMVVEHLKTVLNAVIEG